MSPAAINSKIAWDWPWPIDMLGNMNSIIYISVCQDWSIWDFRLHKLWGPTYRLTNTDSTIPYKAIYSYIRLPQNGKGWGCCYCVCVWGGGGLNDSPRIYNNIIQQQWRIHRTQSHWFCCTKTSLIWHVVYRNKLPGFYCLQLKANNNKCKSWNPQTNFWTYCNNTGAVLPEHMTTPGQCLQTCTYSWKVTLMLNAMNFSFSP